jgi:hypothetical protein
MVWRRRRSRDLDPEIEEIRAAAREDRLVYACCLCGEAIERSDVDPCALVLIPRWGRPNEVSQQFFAHLDCFRRAGANTDELYVLDEDYE